MIIWRGEVSPLIPMDLFVFAISLCGISTSSRTSGNTSFTHVSVLMGHKTVVEILLSAGADRTVVDSYGQTPSSLAAKSGKEDVVKLFNKPQEIRRISVEKWKVMGLDQEKENICDFFQGALWEVRNDALIASPKSVFNLVYGDALDGGTAGSVRWIHLPANNVSIGYCVSKRLGTRLTEFSACVDYGKATGDLIQHKRSRSQDILNRI